ncbi:MAG: alpha-D-ribose 1-methylphosphonate 5-triphosphate diphosphatase [Gammaproteobacteria bacterium]|nr:alpha-D-ribose 1-methylphosphonate 5-triphosphate diphosphatase [Rhodocyclaceae bacterium]MBU3908811.1 alpha-D-ribose 1-methylphosphonate 5-triphosphate diphosphatase [Gammaproteobacteria bacterium]MBU3988420.1 alpha-D-ribose 1-methylphosphonate 5-triphosphate diphosphatase [Gammaproteobacteria bacterium]MBU4003646.1 alpha-D-ribose 1-methylphosphonate 5-triphosphate diphosphatase [Gammaproteobacteria bacterium]MBU4021760.1 alpha-D-ribose 1-methylphosphonate 5-triphosphate diphosphatase [Gamm
MSLILTNAVIITADEEFTGTVNVVDGLIADISRNGTSISAAIDLEGDYLIPGLVELHTDNLEKHLMPRPGVAWPLLSAMLIHDAQIAAAGITTVFDSIRIGEVEIKNAQSLPVKGIAAAIHQGREARLMRAEHLLHLRCEIAAPDVLDELEAMLDEPLLQLMSIMDHTPGQRQWTNIDKYRIYTQKHAHWSDEKLNEVIAELKVLQEQNSLPNRRAILDIARQRNIAVASHDDTTTEHVHEAVAEGISIAEFPTTEEAARAARAHGIGIMMGAPNVVRGGSHSGNVAAADLARLDLLDALSSDYVPASLLFAAFLLRDQVGWGLPQAVATVSRNPARMAKLADRGEIAPGLRADLVRVRETAHIPHPLTVWMNGQRIS